MWVINWNRLENGKFHEQSDAAMRRRKKVEYSSSFSPLTPNIEPVSISLSLSFCGSSKGILLSSLGRHTT